MDVLDLAERARCLAIRHEALWTRILNDEEVRGRWWDVGAGLDPWIRAAGPRLRHARADFAPSSAASRKYGLC